MTITLGDVAKAMTRAHQAASEFTIHSSIGGNTYECSPTDLRLDLADNGNKNIKIRVSNNEIETEAEVPFGRTTTNRASNVIRHENKPVFHLAQTHFSHSTFPFFREQAEATPNVTLAEAKARLRTEILTMLTGNDGPFPEEGDLEKLSALTLTAEVAEENHVSSERQHYSFILSTMSTLNTHFDILEQIATKFKDEDAK